MPPKKGRRGRRRGSKTLDSVAKQSSEAGKSESATRQSKSRKTRKRRTIDLDAWIDRYIDEIVSMTGLDLLGLTREEYLELLKDIIVQLYGSTTSYTKASVLAKRFNRYRDRVYPIIAARLASMLDHPNETQLEFIVFNIGDEILGLAPKLYPIIKKVGREDLLDILRNKWVNAWLRRRLKVLPAQCPKCGFHSLMPDLSCLVCNNTVSEKELKSSIDFTEVLKSAANQMSCDELKEILRRGYVLLNGLGIISPSSQMRSPIDIEVYLSSKEMSLIRDIYRQKCEGGCELADTKEH